MKSKFKIKILEFDFTRFLDLSPRRQLYAFIELLWNRLIGMILVTAIVLSVQVWLFIPLAVWCMFTIKIEQKKEG